MISEKEMFLDTGRMSPPLARVAERFNDAICDLSMTESLSCGVIVAFSGGADSVMLLNLMSMLAKKYGIKVLAVHINHCIRGKEADDDMELCRRSAEKLGVEFTAKIIDVPSLAKNNGEGLEECARKVRYSVFSDILAEREDVSCVVTAHNSSDNAETVIFNMLRGGGLRAMRGIPPVRGNILRPLIYASKADILAAVRYEGYEYATDSTNSDTEYTRNFIRSEIMPLMRRINPDAEGAVMRMCKNVTTDASFIDAECEKFIENNAITAHAHRDALRGLHSAMLYRVLTHMYQCATMKSDNSLERKHVDAIREALLGNSVNFTIDVPEAIFRCERKSCGFYIRKNNDTLLNDKENPTYDVSLHMGRNIIEATGAEIYLFDRPSNEFAENAKNVYKLFIQAVLSFDTMNLALGARNRRPGDSYRTGNMTHMVKKLLNDKKIPLNQRKILPIIYDSNGIAWIPSLGVRDDLKKNSNKNKIYAYFCVNGGKNE